MPIGAAGMPTFDRPGAQHALAGDERRAARGARLLAVGVGEQHPFLGDAVDVGRLVAHQAVRVAAQVRDADVIAPDDEDVGLVASLPCRFSFLLSVTGLLRRDLRRDLALCRPDSPQPNGPTPYTMLTMARKPITSSSSAVISVSESGKLALGVHQAVGLQLRALLAQPVHEHHVIADADDEHRDAEQHQRDAEVVGGVAALQHARLVRLLEHLEDREAEADQRERRANDRHQRPVGAHARALERHPGPPRRELGVDASGIGLRSHARFRLVSHSTLRAGARRAGSSRRRSRAA